MTGPARATGPIRQTRQRTAILECLGDACDFMTAQQLHDQLRENEQPVGLATVYRNLTSLVEQGLVDMIITDEGEAIYRQCEIEEHHHHLLCRVCGHAVEFVSLQLEELAHGIAEKAGYIDLHHRMEIFGLCPDCADPA